MTLMLLIKVFFIEFIRNKSKLIFEVHCWFLEIIKEVEIWEVQSIIALLSSLNIIRSILKLMKQGTSQQSNNMNQLFTKLFRPNWILVYVKYCIYSSFEMIEFQAVDICSRLKQVSTIFYFSLKYHYLNIVLQFF